MNTWFPKDGKALNTDSPSILLYGYGNQGRCDDGAGIFLAQLLADKKIPYLGIETNYQLNVEDALEISKWDIVIFADATEDAIDTFKFSHLLPAPSIGFTTHAMHPSSILALCEELYDTYPQCFLMEIRGHNWGMGYSLSDKTYESCLAAVDFLEHLLSTPNYDRFIKATEHE